MICFFINDFIELESWQELSLLISTSLLHPFVTMLKRYAEYMLFHNPLDKIIVYPLLLQKAIYTNLL